MNTNGKERSKTQYYMTINELIKLPAGKTLEFKKDTSALKKIMRTIVAFANTAGGSIIIGLEDSGEVISIEDL